MRLTVDEFGDGEPVLMIAPAATSARMWSMHQVPALVAAGYRAVLLQSRGIGPSASPPPPYRLADLVADAARAIAERRLAPCFVVGASLGAMVAQELALSRPELVRGAVMLGTRCRTDFVRGKFASAYAAQVRSGEDLSDLDAIMLLTQMFSPVTLADDRRASEWLTLFRAFSARGVGAAMQYEATIIPDRAEALRKVGCPCLVVAFADDSVTPPALCREVASAIPCCRYVEIPGCGHFGFLERPDLVNATLVAFLRTGRSS